MVVWKPDWKKPFMVQNVWYSNGQPSYIILPFEYHTVLYSGVWYLDGYCMCEYLFNVKQKTHSYNAFLHVSKYNLFDVRLFWVGSERLYIKGWVYWNVSPAQIPVIRIPIWYFYSQRLGEIGEIHQGFSNLTESLTSTFTKKIFATGD